MTMNSDDALSTLQSWLFLRLRSELAIKAPGLEEEIAQATPQTEEGLSTWRGRLSFSPIEPWNTLLGQAFSLRYCLVSLDSAVELMKLLPIESCFVLRDIVPVLANNCLESLEDLIKVAGRRRLLDRAARDDMAALLAMMRNRPEMSLLRNMGAHGPQQGLGKDSWIDEARKGRYWELMALTGDDGSEILSQLNKSDLAYPEFRQFADFINHTVQADVTRMHSAILFAAAQRGSQ